MFKLSSEASLDGAITVENKFIVEYMPYADGDYVKVYLYGLSLAARKSDADDSVERLARRLGTDVATVNAAIDHWTELGLMSRIGGDVCYFSTRTSRPKVKNFDVDKYREFNRQAQLYISARQIEPNEYYNYYSTMERLNIEWQAMVLIVKYCVDIKGDNVSYTYILAVARNLAQDGYRTADEVGERLDEFGVYYNELLRVLGAMGGKRPDHESVQFYKKWRTAYKFEPEVIYHVAQNIKRGGINALDAKLTQYHESGYLTADAIEKFETERKDNYALAKAVNKAMGLYYDNVDPEIAMYIKPWLGLGFEPNAITAAARYCMKKDLKRLSDLDAVIRGLFAEGITSEEQVCADFARENRFDADIEKLLKLINVKGAVKDVHRAYYTNWTEKWNMPFDTVAYAASLAKDKSNPMGYINSVLSDWHGKNITDTESAKRTAPPVSAAASTAAPTGIVHEKYSEEFLNSLFTTIDEDDK